MVRLVAYRDAFDPELVPEAIQSLPNNGAYLELRFGHTVPLRLGARTKTLWRRVRARGVGARVYADRGLYRHACVLARSYVYRVRYTGPGPAIQVVTTTLHLFLKKFRLPAVLLQNLGPCIFLKKKPGPVAGRALAKLWSVVC